MNLSLTQKSIIFCLLLFSCKLIFANDAMITDMNGRHTFKNIPQRVITLDWISAENLMALGIQPVGMADKEEYEKWVKKSGLSEKISNVGSRGMPDIEKIKSLQPDLIIMSDQLSSIADQLEKIAPVLTFKYFDAHHKNISVAEDIFRQTARVFHKEDEAQNQLQQQKESLAMLKNKLLVHFNHKLPSVTSIQFNTPSSILVYGDNSMPQYVLEKLGLAPLLPQTATQWGVTQIKSAELGRIKNGFLLYFEPFDTQNKLSRPAQWDAIPIVQHGHALALPALWTYGGPHSIPRMAEAMTKVLLEIKVNAQ